MARLLVGLLVLLWRVVSVVVPATLAVAVVWFSGAEVLPRPRRYARRVHVVGRLAVTAAAVGLLWTPAPTLWVLGAGAAATAGGAVANRVRMRSLEGPRRVRVQVGVRPERRSVRSR